MRTEFNICFYHNLGSDGICAAWVVKNAVSNSNDLKMVRSQSIFTNHTCDCKNADIICVDVIPCKELLLLMLEICNSFTILDHHKTNKKILGTIEHDNLTTVFDMTRSGCQIAWDYFHESERPWFLDYIADRYLWAWKLPNSKEINVGLHELGYNTIDKFDELVINNNTEIIESIRKFGEDKLTLDNIIKEIKFETSLFNKSPYIFYIFIPIIVFIIMLVMILIRVFN